MHCVFQLQDDEIVCSNACIMLIKHKCSLSHTGLEVPARRQGVRPKGCTSRQREGRKNAYMVNEFIPGERMPRCGDRGECNRYEMPPNTKTPDPLVIPLQSVSASDSCAIH